MGGVAIGAFHDEAGVFHHVDAAGLSRGPSLQRKSYVSFAAFNDLDGDAWVLQEVTTRLTGPVPQGETAFTAQLSDVVGRLPSSPPVGG